MLVFTSSFCSIDTPSFHTLIKHPLMHFLPIVTKTKKILSNPSGKAPAVNYSQRGLEMGSSQIDQVPRGGTQSAI